MHNDKEIHLECECHSHALHIERDPCFDKGDPLWFGSFWERGYYQRKWTWRWRQAWNTLWSGRPYGDEVVLKKEQLEELSQYIQKQLQSIK